MHFRKKFLVLFQVLFAAAAQGQHVSGKVISLDGGPIGGVNILLKGTPSGTATNMNGRFSLDVPEGDDILTFNLLKHKTVEQSLTVHEGLQYHITVTLSRKTQTFNKSDVVVDELPLDCQVIEGTVIDPAGQPLPGAHISQQRNSFSAETDMNGKFRLPLPDGADMLSITLPGFKLLDVPIDVGKNDISVDVTLAPDNVRFRTLKSVAEIAPVR
jgi:hypothetical protein